MARHLLQLNFPADCPNEGVFLVDDISIYDGLTPSGTAISPTASNLPITCVNLQITPPGYVTPSILNVVPYFHLVLNACTIGLLSSSDCYNSLPELPDGLWNFRYSVAPNDKVFVEYKIFRITSAMNKYYELLYKIGLNPCLPDNNTKYQLASLDIIRNYLLSAKITAENKHQFSDAINQYDFAIGLLKKMT